MLCVKSVSVAKGAALFKHWHVMTISPQIAGCSLAMTQAHGHQDVGWVWVQDYVHRRLLSLQVRVNRNECSVHTALHCTSNSLQLASSVTLVFPMHWSSSTFLIRWCSVPTSPSLLSSLSSSGSVLISALSSPFPVDLREMSSHSIPLSAAFPTVLFSPVF